MYLIISVNYFLALKCVTIEERAYSEEMPATLASLKRLKTISMRKKSLKLHCYLTLLARIYKIGL